MKNSPEHILKKMYTSEKRAWNNDCGFSHTSSLSMAHVVPDSVVALTGNTTVKLDLEQYLLTDSTPTAVFETLRIDTRVFFCPQRLYTRGIYGNNITEGVNLEQLPLPRANLKRYSTTYNLVGANTGDATQECFFNFIARGSLLHRLGVAPTAFLPVGVNLPLDPMHVVDASYTMEQYRTDRSLIEGSYYPRYEDYNDVNVNFAVVAAYYDICRNYLANKFVDEVPIEKSPDWRWDADYEPDTFTPTAVIQNRGRGVNWFSLSIFGERINWLRGVLNATDTYENQSFYNIDRQMYISTDLANHNRLYFAGVPLLDKMTILGQTQNQVDAQINSFEKMTFEEIANKMHGLFSNTGLWPARYDSHYQTMFFKPEDIDGLVAVDLDGDTNASTVQNFRLGETRYQQMLKRILRGRTTEDWIDVNFGVKLKLNDKPICVGSDSFIVNFQQIVATAGSEDGLKLGDTGGRGVGGTKKAFDDKGRSKKTITFTTQEPGYLITLISATPNVAYGDVGHNLHDYDTLADFPLPTYSGKLFQDLKVSNFVKTNKKIDDVVIGKQPYGFDYMTNFDRVGALYSSNQRASYVFKRDFDMRNITEEDAVKYLRSVYVEGETFDQNFNDIGANAGQNFSVKSAYNMRLCLPLEKQVTDYNV